MGGAAIRPTMLGGGGMVGGAAIRPTMLGGKVGGAGIRPTYVKLLTLRKLR